MIDKQRPSDAMKCPHCQADVTLTWSRYFRVDPFHLVCPSCGARLKVTWPLRYWFYTLLHLLGSVLLFTGVANHFVGLLVGLCAGALIAIPFGFVIDRWIEQRLMRLKIDSEQG